MVKILRYGLALGLFLAFAAPVFAQNDYPRFQLAPGYGNLKFGIPGLEPFGLGPAHHSGFILDTNYNFTPMVGLDLFTGYYSLGNSSTLYTNTFGLNASLRKNARIIPYGTAGFGFGYLNIQNQGGEQAMATRIGGGADIPLGDSMAIRADVTHMGFHFEHQWNGGMNISVGIVFNLSQ
jgi:opacity protein-like surface antigen